MRLHMYNHLLIQWQRMFLYFFYNNLFFLEIIYRQFKTKFCVLSRFTYNIIGMTLFINIDFLTHRKKGSKYSSTRLFLNSNKSQKMFFWRTFKNTWLQWKWSQISQLFFLYNSVYLSRQNIFFSSKYNLRIILLSF